MLANLATSRITIFKLVSVAEESGLSPCVDPEGERGSGPSPEKSQINRVSLQYWSGSP